MKNYYRIMLGKKSSHAEACRKNNFIGVDFGIDVDLEGKLPDNWRLFNQEFVPIYMKNHPNKTKVSAGLACGAVWTVTKGIQNGDII